MVGGASRLGAVGLWKRPHQIQLLTLLVSVDGRSLVMIDELVQIVELALADAVHVAFDMNAEMLVAARCF